MSKATSTERGGRGDDSEATPAGLLQTADRALLLLLAFDQAHPEWGVTEAALRFGWSTTVAHRLLATLTYRGFLDTDEITHRYRIGPAALQLSRQWQQTGFWTLLRPLLADLSKRTGDTALIAVPDGFYVRCVLAVEGESGRLRYHPTGELYPAHSGATSKAYFAFVPEADCQGLFAVHPVGRFTDRTVIDAEALESEFALIRQRGYAFTVGEYDPGVGCIAAPMMLHGSPWGSISLAGEASRFSERLEDRIAALLGTAELIERRLSRAPSASRVPSPA